MPDRVKEKLVELLNNSFEKQYEKRGLLTAQHTAADLIANGVTVQEWISVNDRLPTPYVPVLVCKQPLGGHQPFMTVDYITIGYGETKIWVCDIGTWKNEVTHWMPLPQPPKGE